MMRKTTGSFHSAARFIVSPKVPWLVAPSPIIENRVLGLEVVAGERDAGGQRQAAADDAVAAEEAPLPVEEVHRAAAALRDAALAPEQLGHDGVRIGPARERLAVLPVRRHEVIALVERLGGADDRRLLADAQVQEAADLGLRMAISPARSSKRRINIILERTVRQVLASGRPCLTSPKPISSPPGTSDGDSAPLPLSAVGPGSLSLLVASLVAIAADITR